MKCPTCGAWSSVLATRGTTRRRECANGHRFSTLEVPPGVVSQKDYRAFRRGAALRARNWTRDRYIVADPRGSTTLARDLGITEARVRQIRAKARKESAA